MKFVTEVVAGTAQLLDVRTVGEWGTGHAKGALHIPLARLREGERGVLDKKRTVYIYCATGARAHTAAVLLAMQGYTVFSIGGLIEWRDAGGEWE